MKILCIFSKYPLNQADSNITKDLARELKLRGHSILVASLLEKKHKKETFLFNDNGVEVLNVKSGNMFDSVSLIEKFITVLTLPKILYKNIKKYFGSHKVDLIIAHTPFMASHRLIKPLKKLFGCKALLILWDIFPQNAVDIGLMKKGLLYSWLKYNERKMFEQFELISCMSEGNKAYLLKNYSYLDAKALFVCYNWARLSELPVIDRARIRNSFGFSDVDKICVFGGNIGKPQKIENIIKLANLTASRGNIKYLFIGKGVELSRLKKIILNQRIANIKIIDFVERSEYEKLIMVCDLGLVSLDENFTVPNFPSKTVDYFRCGLPVFALLDQVSANDYGIFIKEFAQAGTFILAKKLEENLNDFFSLIDNEEKLKTLSNNAKKFFIRELDVAVAAKKIEKSISETNNV